MCLYIMYLNGKLDSWTEEESIREKYRLVPNMHNSTRVYKSLPVSTNQ